MSAVERSLVSHLAAAQAEEEEDRQLTGARESFPELDIVENFGGYMAYPKGTLIIQASTLDALVAKLRQRTE